MERPWVTVDGNEATAAIAYQLAEVIAIYPITPPTPVGELADTWSAQRCGTCGARLPQVVEMQFEGGAAGRCTDALDLRRSSGCDGGACDRLRAAGLQFGPGGAGSRPDRARRDLASPREPTLTLEI